MSPTDLSALKYSKQLKRPGPAPMPWRALAGAGVIALGMLAALHFLQSHAGCIG